LHDMRCSIRPGAEGGRSLNRFCTPPIVELCRRVYAAT
jgi:hypothetical protein